MIVPIVLAGGSGTRLWPLSRELYPKQLLDLTDRQSLLQNTFLRLNGLADLGDSLLICNDDHRFMAAEQLREIGLTPRAMILEPIGRNTAPAVAVAALTLQVINPDAIMLVLPADHLITDIAAFHAAVRTGAEYAAADWLITFGIVPEAPETGYGYIKSGAPAVLTGQGPAPAGPARIERFVEKPDFETARAYVDSGDYYWNSGMFMFKARMVLAELERHAPGIIEACRRALDDGREDLKFFRLDPAAFEACPSDSIDYAVMEKTSDGVMIPLRCGWSDLGSWEALFQAGEKDPANNVIQGDVLVADVKDSYLRATSRLIAAVGLEGHVVIETADAVLISPRDKVQDIKAIVARLNQDGRRESISHPKVYRPWGNWETIDTGSRYQVRRVTIKPGHMPSLHRHYHCAEHWTVVTGTAEVVLDGKQMLLRENESMYIPIGAVHQVKNQGKIPLELIEIRTGTYLKDDDIIRLSS